MTNFSCGPDSFLEHFYKHVLGDKPALILELDEHSAVAGVLTRVEAYRNVVKTFTGKVGKPWHPRPSADGSAIELRRGESSFVSAFRIS